ncbi:MAG: PLP-dependent aminotransferase family protein [Acidobacteriota bacterium]|nr:PLP-dependent aminotransferase family protein [Acidobacteriota bacterium]
MTRRASTFELILPPRPPGIPSFHWLRNSLRTEILSGRLTPGARLPASRDLGRQYGLSRGTILTALDELRAEGYLEARKGSGTYVSSILPEHLLPSHKSGPDASSIPEGVQHLSAFAQRLRPFAHNVTSTSLAFRTNLPALDLFPTTLWAQVSARRLRAASTRLLFGAEAQGYRPLREAVAHYARSSRGVRCEAAQVVIVSGIQEALDLTARLLLNPGDNVLVEDPGYRGAWAAFRSAGARLTSIPIDHEGAAPQESDMRNARLLYVTPGHQYPMGTTMSLRRRLELLVWARQHETAIFEDDYDSEFRFSGRPVPAMQGLDCGGRVLFAGSFNKVLFPSLRLGYLILPHNLVEVFARAKAITTSHHPLLDQAVLTDFIEQGHFGRHLRRMRQIYQQRLAALLEAANLHLSEYLHVSNIEAGLQTTGMLQHNLSAEAVVSRAALDNIDVVALSRYCSAASVPGGLQIGFAAVNEKEIKSGVLKLAQILKSMVAQPAARTQPARELEECVQ